MQLTVPKIVRSVDLADYAQELQGGLIWVWVNPPRALLRESRELQAEFTAFRTETKDQVPDPASAQPLLDRLQALSQGNFAWWARLWSQAEDPETHWTVDEVAQLVGGTGDTDPGLWPFLQKRSWELIAEHREIARKN